jgi:hypothetical protein
VCGGPGRGAAAHARQSNRECQVGEHRPAARVTMNAMAESESDGAPKQEVDQYHTGRES